MVHIIGKEVDIGQIIDDYATFLTSADYEDIRTSAEMLDTRYSEKKTSTSARISLQEDPLPVLARAGGDEAISVAHLAQVHQQTHIPVDYGVIYFGTPHDAQQSRRIYDHFTAVQESTQRVLDDLGSDFLTDTLPGVEDVHRMSGLYHARMIRAWLEMLTTPFDTYAIQEFVQTVVDG